MKLLAAALVLLLTVVTASAQAVFAPAPPYPREARAKGISGTGWYVLTVNSTGRVISISVGRSSGHKILDKAAIDAFKHWRFKPGTPPRVKVPVRWTPDSER